jgi:putative ABC transport system permease protein
MEKFYDIIHQAFDSIRSQKLRAFFTLLSIAIGVFAITFSGSLTNSIDSTVNKQIESLGRYTFFITRMPAIQMGGNDWFKYRNRPEISYRQYLELQENIADYAIVTGAAQSAGFVIKSSNLETDPDVQLVGTDHNYFITSSDAEIMEGRALVQTDIEYHRNFAVVGNDVLVKIFPNEKNVVGKEIKIDNKPFTIVGTLKPKGALLGQSQDNIIIIPLSQFLTKFSSQWEQDVNLIIKANNPIEFSYILDETIGQMRIIRNLKPWQENNFEIQTNESLSDQFGSLTGYLTYFGVFCGIIALIAAGVGITNIMLITVKERTREIGIRKAVGAKKRLIVLQFVSETIVLTLLGGLFGTIFGVVVGGGLGIFVGTSFTISVKWVLISLSISVLLGLASGVFPAYKAASLDPVDALRYE